LQCAQPIIALTSNRQSTPEKHLVIIADALRRSGVNWHEAGIERTRRQVTVDFTFRNRGHSHIVVYCEFGNYMYVYIFCAIDQSSAFMSTDIEIQNENCNSESQMLAESARAWVHVSQIKHINTVQISSPTVGCPYN